MFYVKGEKEIVAIEEDNILTICPECGKPHCVDPESMVVDGSLDLYGTGVCCKACSAKKMEDKRINRKD